MPKNEHIFEPDEEILESLMKRGTDKDGLPWRMVGVQLYGLHKGYFGIMNDANYYHPNQMSISTSSYIGPGSVVLTWPGGGLNYIIPQGHVGVQYFEAVRPKKKSIPVANLLFWLPGGQNIQDAIDKIHVVEYQRKEQAVNNYARVTVSCFWFDDATLKTKVFLQETIHDSKYDLLLDVPPE